VETYPLGRREKFWHSAREHVSAPQQADQMGKNTATTLWWRAGVCDRGKWLNGRCCIWGKSTTSSIAARFLKEPQPQYLNPYASVLASDNAQHLMLILVRRRETASSTRIFARG
jgi:hypothetical protein